VAATLFLLAVAVACGGDDSSGADQSSVTPTSAATSSVEGADPAADVDAIFEEVVAAHGANDLDRLVELSSGPARAFAERGRHFAAATGTTDLFPNVHARTGTVSVSGDGIATLDGFIAYGPTEANARELTNFEFRRDGERWLLDSYDRAGTPIGRWLSPGSGSAVASGPIAIELVSMFADLTCAVDAESDCPDELRNTVSLDLVVDNGSEGELAAGMLTLPDGSESAAWLETPSGGAYGLISAQVRGFPPMATAAVSGLFAAADDLASGGVLHIVLVDADGADHRLDVPVPAYPHDWSTDS
jgi:hypothetical protein